MSVRFQPADGDQTGHDGYQFVSGLRCSEGAKGVDDVAAGDSAVLVGDALLARAACS